MKKYLIIITLINSLVFTGCLKDTPTNDYSNIQPIIIIPNANWPSTTQAATVTYANTSTPQTIQLYARVSWENALSIDIKVSFIKDTAAVIAYNAKFAKTFIYMPDSCYSMSSMQVTISANQREAFIPITIYPKKVGISTNKMLAFTISDAQGQNIASNYKTIVMPIKVQ